MASPGPPELDDVVVALLELADEPELAELAESAELAELVRLPLDDAPPWPAPPEPLPAAEPPNRPVASPTPQAAVEIPARTMVPRRQRYLMRRMSIHAPGKRDNTNL